MIDQLDHIVMSPSERLEAREDLRRAESFVDALFGALAQANAVAAMMQRTVRVLAFGCGGSYLSTAQARAAGEWL